jgi:hypothetical protein
MGYMKCRCNPLSVNTTDMICHRLTVPDTDWYNISLYKKELIDYAVCYIEALYTFVSKQKILPFPQSEERSALKRAVPSH